MTREHPHAETPERPDSGFGESLTRDPYAFHRVCTSLFRNGPTSPASPSPIPKTNHYQTNPPSPTPLPQQKQAITIDWTFPSTRRRRSQGRETPLRGLRGLWRSIKPRRWRGRGERVRASREGRIDGVSDKGSVRRIKIGDGNHHEDANDEHDAGEKGEEQVWRDGRDEDGQGGREERICGWTCFGMKV
ncbi:MAG: hypothetical protein L6R41_006544 [Letrouitia leprolyta]|nr:MAG: hypothetical protein L6R41_006544 [Letrouitia leprolyta]